MPLCLILCGPVEGKKCQAQLSVPYGHVRLIFSQLFSYDGFLAWFVALREGKGI